MFCSNKLSMEHIFLKLYKLNANSEALLNVSYQLWKF